MLVRLFGNVPTFALLYILFLTPIYLLPWLTSNSTFHTLAANLPDDANPFLWAYVAAAGALIAVAWARGRASRHHWLPALPIAAGAVDLLPYLSLVPALSALFHIAALVLGTVPLDVRRDGDKAAPARTPRSPVPVIAGASLLLSGCAAALIPMTVGMAAVSGFQGYKTFQTTTGGTVEVAFDTGGSATPLTPEVRRIAVWQNGVREIRLTERLHSTGRFDVLSPNATAEALSRTGRQPVAGLMTAQEQAAFYGSICKATKADLVLFAADQGINFNKNMWSLERANNTRVVDLLAFSCKTNSITWTDRMNVKVEVAGSAPPEGEIARIAGDAWADRLLGVVPAASKA